MGMMRINRRVLAPLALPTNDRTKVMKKVIGIMAIAPREYVRTTQAEDAATLRAWLA